MGERATSSMRMLGFPGLRCAALTLALFAFLGPGPARAVPTEVGGTSAGVYVPFLPNKGQTDALVAYYASTVAATVYVTRRGELVYALRGPDTGPSGGRFRHVRTSPVGWSLTETLLDGRPLPTAGVPSGTQVSVFLGPDPARQLRNLPTYTTVSLGEVWPGVVMALHAGSGSVEKHFTVKPGASPDLIRVRVDGATALRLTPRGELVAETALGEVIFSAPVAYQEANGRHRAVPVAYRLQGHGYGFALGAYDPARPLEIDPFVQSTFLGATGIDNVFSLAVHPITGDVYVAGFTDSPVFPGTTGGAQANSAGAIDAVVARFNNSLTTLRQATFLGGSGADQAFALAIHPTTGDVYVAGVTESIVFPGTIGGAQASNAGLGDVFVARFDSSLTTLRQSTFLGGSLDDEAHALAIHPTTGDVYVAGVTASTTFPGTIGGAQASSGGGNDDSFVFRLDSTLTMLLQSTFLGGSGDDLSFAIAIHPTTGEVYVGGLTDAATFPGASGGAQSINGGGTADAFVARLNSTLTTLHQSSLLGGTGFDQAVALAIHPTTGDVYMAGFTDSPAFPGTAGGAQASNGGFGDAFVARFNSALTTLHQSTFLGGSGFDGANALAIHSATGDIYVAGTTDSPAFPGTTGGAQARNGGLGDAFVARLNRTLTTLRQSTFFGGSGADEARAMALHAATGDVYVAGNTNSPALPDAAGGAQASNGGGSYDAFVARITGDLTSATSVPILSEWSRIVLVGLLVLAGILGVARRHPRGPRPSRLA